MRRENRPSLVQIMACSAAAIIRTNTSLFLNGPLLTICKEI